MMITTRKLVLAPLTLPLKSNFSGMGLVPFHHTLTIVEGNMTMPHFLLPKWNGTHAIPMYNGCNGREYENATLFYCLSGMGFMPFHHALMQVECNDNNATFFIIA